MLRPMQLPAVCPVATTTLALAATTLALPATAIAIIAFAVLRVPRGLLERQLP